MMTRTLEIMRQYIGSCREWLAEKNDRCGAPAEYVLWGKLIDPEGLGPRCYDCAARHVGHRALAPYSNYALINLVSLARAIDLKYRLEETDESRRGGKN